MAVLVAFLRGVNVGGNKKVPMADLKAALEKAGFKPVKTYLNSGNVVFEAGKLSDAKAAEAVRQAVKDSSGVDSHVQVRSAAALKKALKADPFPETDGLAPADQPPRRRLRQRGFQSSGGQDRRPGKAEGPWRRDLRVVPGRGLRFRAVQGQLAKALAVELTARNRKTVQKLVEIAEAMGEAG